MFWIRNTFQGGGPGDQRELQRQEAGLPALHQPQTRGFCCPQEMHRQRLCQLSTKGRS